MFEIPLPRSIRYIVIPVWVVTLLYPAYMVLTNASIEKLAYSFFPFIGIGLLLFLIIRLQCPKEILTTKEGAWVVYRGSRETMIPWKGMVFVPRKRSLAYGFEDLVGISIEGHKIAYAEVSSRSRRRSRRCRNSSHRELALPNKRLPKHSHNYLVGPCFGQWIANSLLASGFSCRLLIKIRSLPSRCTANDSATARI